MDTDKPKPAYYAIIPAAVRYDQELPAGAKLLYGEITALCGKEGYCWASNGYFAKLYGTDKGTISRWIRKLIKQKHLKCKIDKTAGNKRHLYLCAKMSIPIGKNAHTPIGKNAKHNNTSVIKTGKGGKDIKQKPTPKPQASAPAPESKEDISKRNYFKARTKAEAKGLPIAFLQWFEQCVLSRWPLLALDGFEPITLRDWHDRFWTRFDQPTRTGSLQRHKEQCDKKNRWKPQLGNVVNIAGGIVTKKAKAAQLLRQTEKEKQRREKMKLIRSQPPASIADGYRNMNPEELLSLYGSRKFDKTLIDKHCPEVLQAAREELKQKITGVKQNEKEKSKKKMGHNPKQAAV